MLQHIQPETLFPSQRLGFTQVVTAAIAPAVGARVAQFFSGVKPPASTWVGVQALFHPDFLVEIEAMAVVPDRM